MTSASSKVPAVLAAFTKWLRRAPRLQLAASTGLLGYAILYRGCAENGILSPWASIRLTSQLALTCIAVFWLGRALWHGRQVSSVGFEPALLVLFAAFALNVLLSHDPRRSLGELALMLFYLLWFFVVYDLVKNGWSVDAVVQGLLWVGGAIILIGLYEALQWFLPWVTAVLARQPVAAQPVRIMSIFEHPNLLSAFLNLLLPLALVQWAGARSRASRLLVGLWLAGNLAAQLLTSSRAGWIATAVTLGVYAALRLRAAGGEASRRAARWWALVRGRRLWLAGGSLLVLLATAGASGLAWFQLQHGSHGTSLWYARVVLWDIAWKVFRSSPWHGTGLSTFTTESLKYILVPPYLKYAHSVPLAVLAEGGLLGFLPFALLCVVTIRACRRAWREAGSAVGRLYVAGGVASLAGFAAHGLFEDWMTRPALMVTALVVLTVALAGAESGQAGAVLPAPARRRTFHPVFLLAPALLLLGASLWCDWAMSTFNQGVAQSRNGRWEAAAEYFARASARDPGFAFYYLQRGFALGTALADGRHDGLLADAIAAYEAGIRLEPEGSANHANLFALYWQAGLRERALPEFQRALQLAQAGIWDTGQNQYGDQVFHRIGARPDLLPQVQTLVSDGGIITEAALGQFIVLARNYQKLEEAGASGGPLPVLGRWVTGVTLQQAKRRPEHALPGGSVDFNLIWLVHRPLPRIDYTVFVQMRGRDNQNLAQCDTRLLGTRNIPSMRGDEYWVTSLCTLTVPDGLEPGAYDVKAGLYELRTMERAAVIDDRSGEAAIDLDAIQVVSSSP
jgi:O-antigen ligase